MDSISVTRPTSPVLVLGQRLLPSRSVNSFSWEARPQYLNVNDYDTVIADFSGQRYPAQIRLDLDQFRHFLTRRDARLILIGVLDGMHGRLGLSRIGSPFEVLSRQAVGKALSTVPNYHRYFAQYVQQWSLYHLDVQYSDHSFLFSRLFVDGDQVLGHDLTPLALTSFDQAIAFSLTITSADRRMRSAEIVWLPSATDPKNYVSAVLWLLQNIAGHALEREPPGWVRRYALHGEQAVRHRIAQQKLEIRAAQRELAAGERGLADLQTYKRLLYEQNDALEIVVRAVLRELGAHVDDPPTNEREDGSLVDPNGRRAVLEIKGRTGGLQGSDLRELEEWKQGIDDREGLASPGAKGILIANLLCNQAPADRSHKAMFHPNTLELLQRYGFCLLHTSQLFRAISDLRANRFDATIFWAEVFATVGVATLPTVPPEGAGQGPIK